MCWTHLYNVVSIYAMYIFGLDIVDHTLYLRSPQRIKLVCTFKPQPSVYLLRLVTLYYLPSPTITFRLPLFDITYTIFTLTLLIIFLDIYLHTIQQILY